MLKRIILLCLLVMPLVSYASGFQRFAVSTAVLGNFGAGVAAEGSDASINFFNPAGLTLITQPQLVFTGNFANHGHEFNGQAGYNGFVEQAHNVQGGSWEPMPAIHYAVPLADRVVMGLSVTMPFGLVTKYPYDSPVRYVATRTEIITVDINPSLGVQLSDKFSVGVGISGQAGKVLFDQVTNTPPINPALDNRQLSDGISWAFGWNVGLLYEVSENTRLGFSYRTAMEHKIKGKLNVYGPSAADESFDIFGDFTLPATAIASFYHQMDPKFALLGSVFYTQWDVFDHIVFQDCTTGLPVINSPQNFRNTWRVALGANYQLTEKWLLRTGVGYDQTPTNDIDRSVRIPDGDRIGVAIGARYKPKENLWIDMGYTHLFIKDTPINYRNDGISLQGNSKNHADLLGIQLVLNLM